MENINDTVCTVSEQVRAQGKALLILSLCDSKNLTNQTACVIP
jgi:hypothetical protein